jgi:hypothetical protein
MSASSRKPPKLDLESCHRVQSTHQAPPYVFVKHLRCGGRENVAGESHRGMPHIPLDQAAYEWREREWFVRQKRFPLDADPGVLPEARG